MPPENHISEELKAVITVTAQEVVKEAIKEFRREMAQDIKLHATECKATSLGAFKGIVMAVLGGIAVLIGDWVKSKIIGG